VRTRDVGVGDRHHARVGGDGDGVVGGAEQLAREAAAPVVLAACLRPERRDYRIYRDRARARAAAA
jgi:hypothetical protein